MSAMAPASQMLTNTWLLSADAVANIRKRVEPGEYFVAGTQDADSATAYCPSTNGGDVSSDSSGANSDEDAVLIVRLCASNTVTIGMMHDPDPAFVSEQGDCVW